MAIDPETGVARSPRRRGMRTGYTTGACAAAATRAACLALAGQRPATVDIPLPAGLLARFDVHSCESRSGSARAAVIKDAGDDPDVTHGAEVGAHIELAQRRVPARAEWSVAGDGEVMARLASGSTLSLRAGEGVGVVTRPGLGLPVGGPAINPVPRRMIARSVRDALPEPAPLVTVTISVRNGARLAERTLNGRLGILGGLSILGTTGIVRPYSTAAWRASVLQGVDVAAAEGCEEIVASTGGRSEAYARALLPHLPEPAFVEMGEFTGHLLKRAAERGLRRVTLAGMVGKLSKIAQGHFMTHVAGNQVDLRYLAEVARRIGAPPDLIDRILAANTARHAQELVVEAGQPDYFDLVAADARGASGELVGGHLEVVVLLFDFEGHLLGRAGG